MTRKVLNGLDLNSQRLQNLGAASALTDAVNLGQVNNLINGLSWHGALIAASTGNVNLASPGTTLDGITLANGQRVLLKNQTDATQNGVYIFNGSASALTRAADGVQGTLNGGAAFYVEAGTTNGDKGFTLTTDDPITVGTTALAFSQFSGSGVAYTAGTGLTLNGSTFAIDPTVVARKYAANVGDGSSSTITVAHNLGTLDVIVQVVLVSTGETIETDTVRTNTNTVALTFPSAPAAGQYRAVITG